MLIINWLGGDLYLFLSNGSLLLEKKIQAEYRPC